MTGLSPVDWTEPPTRFVLFTGKGGVGKTTVAAARAVALADRGRPAPLLLETHLAADVMGGEIAAHLQRHGDAIDGVFAASDVIAMTTLRALADRGVPVPGGMQVVGYDDLPIAVQTVPRISTVRQDFAGGARAMVERLFARMAGDAPGSLRLPPELVVRGSTRA